jgi:hypothetical protein
MRIPILCTATLCLLAIFSQVVGQDQSAVENPLATSDESERFEFWMKVKLGESQKLFAALARADFTSIVESGQKLKKVSALEGFVRRKTPGYSTQLKSFEFAVGEILRQAAKENIEGVTSGFQQLTLSCVKCHKQMRQ